MVEGVKRDYRSEVRAAQALATRRSIVAAATRLFVSDGYGATTIDAVAEAANVSRKTVFTAVGGKLDLLKLALDWAVAGDDQSVALTDRANIRLWLDHAEPREVINGLAGNLAEIGARVGPIYSVLEVAAGVDPAARELVEQSQRVRLADARKVVTRLRDLDALTTQITHREAVDLIWLAMDPGLFDRLVRLRRWSPRRFKAWLGDALCRQLLADQAV
ncbi:transcriptional regulator [Mycobacterium sp. JS623]|uniref:TetR/AcrR family transcriptional regulator n=1 Tax=Mycobacterium sp. JS623 TaxID=212767 RepID=UPI0002A56C0A|nr:helix-turn-helix domain-containing protein [Mycobacterium sp. JS623]AGB23663.1 transcriptional regulator [Mycobacterium sp. JS623]